MTCYTLIRSRRRSLAIHVQDGEVTVRAPLRVSKREIDAFVASKAHWLADKLARSRELAARREAFAPDYGDAILFRGAEYPVAARDGTRAGFDGELFYFPPELSREQLKALIVRVYRMLAKARLSERVAHFAARMGVRPSAVRVTAAKTRWGSCSAKKSLSFAWRLALADDEVIDYVVVHELAHIREMNHSARFWAVVEGVLPDYRARRARLKALRERLCAEDWD
ncbi:MAG: M48 family metallopeptidase [Clostridiales Family XIII bacterium]|jgi:predicted metal-dependent hydrolase|nr:M48 family metallopeptidase [Clostridiales Family XIII bacterium]